MNIGAENMLGLNPGHPVQDMQFRVESPVVAHLLPTFREDWEFVTGEDLEGQAHFLELKKSGGRISENQKLLKEEIEASGAIWEEAVDLDEALNRLKE